MPDIDVKTYLDRLRKALPYVPPIPIAKTIRWAPPPRRVLEAVLWILNTGPQRHMLPQSYRTTKPCIVGFSLDAIAKFCVKS